MAGRRVGRVTRILTTLLAVAQASVTIRCANPRIVRQFTRRIAGGQAVAAGREVRAGAAAATPDGNRGGGRPGIDGAARPTVLATVCRASRNEERDADVSAEDASDMDIPARAPLAKARTRMPGRIGPAVRIRGSPLLAGRGTSGRPGGGPGASGGRRTRSVAAASVPAASVPRPRDRQTTSFSICRAMRSAWRIASATIVSVGFSAPPLVTLAAVGDEQVRHVVRLPVLVADAVLGLLALAAGAEVVRRGVGRVCGRSSWRPPRRARPRPA